MFLKAITYIIALFIISSNFITSADDDKVKLYNAENFANSIQTNNHFVMFFAPWCGHCKRLHPIWEQLADMLNEDEESKVTIAKVDCTTDHDLCSEQDVTGYPTLKFFKLGGGDSVKFRGTRDLPSLTSFINEQLGSSAAPPEVTESPAPLRGLVELTEANFDATIKTGNHFVKFFAPWCGHCQKLAPTWDELAESFESNPDVSIAKVDCTVHRSVCNSLEIKGYPTLLFFKDGSMAEKYSGQRTLDELKSFVKRMAGTDSVAASSEETVGSGSGSVPLLNAETFRDGIAEGLSFVKFFAPWCGHCKRLAPTWNELSFRLKDIPNVRVVRVDCTQPDSKELCNEQEVEGFPTLLVYRNGEKISEYNGSRNIEDMYQYIASYFQRDEL